MSAIDLRSDTVTHPTEEMRRAMAAADVGDDVFGEDPTVNALEERAAELLGKEAGLFVSSGTMGNLVSLMAYVPRGGEIIAGAQSHIVRDEAAGHAVVVGASVLQLRDRPDGSLDPGEVAAAFRDPSDPHEPITSLVAIENIHHGEFIAKSAALAELNAPALSVAEGILQRGYATGAFRRPATAIDMHLMISAYCFFRMATRHTFGAIFGLDMLDPGRRDRYRQLIGDMIVSYLTTPAG
jgi:hypothetical protein